MSKPPLNSYTRNVTSTTVASSLIKLVLMFTNLVKSLPLHGIVKVASDDATSETHKTPQLTPEEFYANLFTSIFLVLAGGVFAGLTLGLMGQDEVYLKVIATSGEPHERKHARNVLRLIGRGKHWVLVTLLLSNVITNETLPIVLDNCLGGGWPAVVTSTVSIVIFGEIIPQSICVRYGLQVGSMFAPFVLVLMYIMYPVAYPCAMLLDHILGEDHGTVYKKSGLKTLVTLHKTMGVERLNQDEVTIISAVLDLKEKPVSSIMTPMDRVYTMSADKLLDEKTVEEIFNAGFSRIPIHLPNEPNNFIGMLLVRVLISYDPEDSLPVAAFPLATLPETGLDTSCLNILNYFQEGKSHMIVVSENPGEPTGAVGVLTLEDVIEELIGEEIVDESDVYVDINKNIKRKHPGPLSKRNLTSYLHHLYQRNGSSPNSKRNSLESPEPPLDLTERIRQGSSSSVITYTANNNNKRPASANTHGPASSVPTTSGTDHEIPPASAPGSKWKPKNPALNPLETNKKFVTIKKPDQDRIESMRRVVTASSPPPHAKSTRPPQSSGSHGSNPVQIGTIYSTEEGAIEEAKKRSFDERSNQKFLLPNEREADVSEIEGHKHVDDDATHYHLDIPMNNQNGNGHTNGGQPISIPFPEQQESRSYRTGGIVESVINVQGVLKTIIENVSDVDDTEFMIDTDVVESPKDKKKKKKSKKKRLTTPSSIKSGSTRSGSLGLEDDDDEDEESKSLLNNGSNSRKSSLTSSSNGKK
ncbi:Protein MAM3 [Candida viswanathii]|uniref:Protein MAM3 n=1 Tax=Candida viswanathii TaxID=5486 RepID=A0A367XX95_9ASCO|nr:Protein MAM3 [Candida viswanathii]